MSNHSIILRGKHDLKSVFLELTDYVEYHFRTEEKIMLKYLDKEPEAIAHLKAHHNFEDTVSALTSELQSKSFEEVVEAALSFLVHWLVEHILDTDTWMVTVILALQQGMSLKQAKASADLKMSGTAKVLIETILTMYDDLTAKTMLLMKEIIERQRAQQQLQLAGEVITNTLESIFICDAQGILVDVNPAFCNNIDIEHDHPRCISVAGIPT